MTTMIMPTMALVMTRLPVLLSGRVPVTLGTPTGAALLIISITSRSTVTFNSTLPLMSLSMGISDETEDAAIAIDETKISEIEATI